MRVKSHSRRVNGGKRSPHALEDCFIVPSPRGISLLVSRGARVPVATIPTRRPGPFSLPPGPLPVVCVSVSLRADRSAFH